MIDSTKHNINCIHRDLLDTVVFSEQINAFSSFYSTEPNWYFDFGDKYYSVTKDNILTLHNVEIQEHPSFIQTIVNKNPIVTKVFDNVEYSGKFEFPQHNFSKVWFETNTMISKDVNLIDRREDSYKFAVPRVDDGTDSPFANRMKGKYVLCNFEHDHPNSYFRIPYIITKFRQSYI